MNIYKWLWSKIGGRPWTFIMRDFYHEVEFAVIIPLLILGWFSRDWLSPREGIFVLCGLVIGYILGHLFWGRRWIKGQEGK